MGSRFHLLLLVIFANLIFSNADEESSSESSQAAELFSTTAEIFEEEEAPIPERPKASCDVFDPFKVLPTEPGHYQIGGAFPLHREDCLELSPSSVQDVVAVQWAMAYWNEQKRPEKGEENADKKTRPKLGLFAGDSCARPKEAISQTLRFLDSIGFHEPSECLASGGMAPAASRRRNSATAAPKLIGILAPKDRESAEAVAQSFQPTFLPIGVFSPAAAHAFLDAKVPGAFIATVPLIGDFIRTALELVKMFDSNLVSIVDYGDNFVPTQKLSEQFRQNGISIAEVVAFDHSLMPSILAKSDSQIIISMVSHQILREAEIGQIEEIRNMQKLWINLELEIDELGNNNEALKRADFLESGEGEKGASAKLQTITIRRQQKYLTDFNAYFLRVLVANYEHYSLLNSYVQNVYNCTQGLAKFPGNKRTKAICGREQLEPKRLAKLHKQSNSIESAINLVYAFAKAAEKIEGDEGKREKCAAPNPSCFDLIRQEILKIGPNEQQNENGGRLPPGFGEQLNGMHFFESKEGAIQMAGIGIEAILAEKEGRDGGNLYKLVEYRTGMDEKGQPNGNVQKFQMPSKLRQIHSRCPQFRPYCLDKCKLASRRRDDQTFLSMPQQFSLYLAAMFDFQNGPNCDRLRRENPASVALPLAFVHSMSTFRQRNAPKSALFNAGEGGMDIGTILIDTCSSAQNLMEFLVDSERNCYKFSQVERNWTITSGATIGYLFGSEEIGSAQSGVLEAMFSNPTSAPIISIANEGNLDGREEREGDEKFGGIFPFGPSNSAMALALAKFLRQMHWTYVNVVLDKSDPTAHSIFKQFQKIASGICIAELTIIGQEGRRQNGGHENEEQTKNKRASAIHKGTNGGAFGGGMAVTSANVTLVFSGAKQAAEYMSTWLRDEFMAAGTSTNVHVMLGDAHDFHLHDPTNLAQYAGTVSFQAKDLSTSEFQNWIRSITPLTLPEVWYWRHVEENWHCALSRSNIGRFHGRMCSGEELLDVNGMGRLAKAGYLGRGVDKMLTAIDQIHLKHCGAERMCEEFVKNGRKWIREILWKMANEEEEDEFEIFQLIPMGSEGKIGYKMFANYSAPRQNKNQNNKIHLMADYRPFPSGIQTANSDELRPIISRCRQPFCKCPSANNNEFDPLDFLSGKASASYIRREPARKGADNSEDFLLVFENSDDPQVEELGGLVERELSDALRIIFLVLSALLCALAVATLLLILIKMYQRKIKGHQSLGILLLVGICGLYSAAFLFAIAPTADSICHLRIGLHALAHSLCFGVIIVKAIQLRNSEALALMGASAQQISYWNYWLLLMFIVAVQIVICMKWLLLEPFDWATNRMASKSPDSPPSDDRILLCSYSSANFVLSQIYTFLLLLLALLLSAQNRNIKRNYKEAKWLFITSLSCTLLLCAWAVCHILVNPLYLDHMTILELHLTGSLLLAFIFGPKLYVLLFYEPILVECAYGGSENGGRGEKSADLFEGEWNQQNAFSPTLSNRSSKMNGPSEMGEEEEEKVTSAFQTILRKKMGGGSGSKISSENPSRTNSVESAKKMQCSNSKGGGTPRIGPKGGMMRDLGRKGAHRPMSPQNV